MSGSHGDAKKLDEKKADEKLLTEHQYRYTLTFDDLIHSKNPYFTYNGGETIQLRLRPSDTNGLVQLHKDSERAVRIQHDYVGLFTNTKPNPLDLAYNEIEKKYADPKGTEIKKEPEEIRREAVALILTRKGFSKTQIEGIEQTFCQNLMTTTVVPLKLESKESQVFLPPPNQPKVYEDLYIENGDVYYKEVREYFNVTKRTPDGELIQVGSIGPIETIFKLEHNEKKEPCFKLQSYKTDSPIVRETLLQKKIASDVFCQYINPTTMLSTFKNGANKTSKTNIKSLTKFAENNLALQAIVKLLEKRNALYWLNITEPKKFLQLKHHIDSELTVEKLTKLLLEWNKEEIIHFNISNTQEDSLDLTINDTYEHRAHIAAMLILGTLEANKLVTLTPYQRFCKEVAEIRAKMPNDATRRAFSRLQKANKPEEFQRCLYAFYRAAYIDKDLSDENDKFCNYLLTVAEKNQHLIFNAEHTRPREELHDYFLTRYSEQKDEKSAAALAMADEKKAAPSSAPKAGLSAATASPAPLKADDKKEAAPAPPVPTIEDTLIKQLTSDNVHQRFLGYSALKDIIKLLPKPDRQAKQRALLRNINGGDSKRSIEEEFQLLVDTTPLLESKNDDKTTKENWKRWLSTLFQMPADQKSAAPARPINFLSAPVVQVNKSSPTKLDLKEVFKPQVGIGNTIFYSKKEGGANDPGPLGGQYLAFYQDATGRIRPQIVFFKQANDNNTIQHRENIAGVLAGSIMNDIAGENIACTYFTTTPSGKQGNPADIYTASIYHDNFADLHSLTHEKEGILDVPGRDKRLIVGKGEFGGHNIDNRMLGYPAYRPGMSKLVQEGRNNRSISAKQLGATDAASLLVGNYQIHSGNKGVAKVSGKDQFCLIDFDGAFRRTFISRSKEEPHGRLPRQVNPDNPSATGLKKGGNYFLATPEHIRLSTDYISGFEEALDSYRKTQTTSIDKSFEISIKNYGTEGFIKYFVRELDTTNPQFQSMPETEEERLVLIGQAKEFLLNGLFARYLSEKQFVLESKIRSIIRIHQKNYDLQTLVNDNPFYFHFIKNHEAESIHEDDEKRALKRLLAKTNMPDLSPSEQEFLSLINADNSRGLLIALNRFLEKEENKNKIRPELADYLKNAETEHYGAEDMNIIVQACDEVYRAIKPRAPEAVKKPELDEKAAADLKHTAAEPPVLPSSDNSLSSYLLKRIAEGHTDEVMQVVEDVLNHMPHEKDILLRKMAIEVFGITWDNKLKGLYEKLHAAPDPEQAAPIKEEINNYFIAEIKRASTPGKWQQFFSTFPLEIFNNGFNEIDKSSHTVTDDDLQKHLSKQISDYCLVAGKKDGKQDPGPSGGWYIRPYYLKGDKKIKIARVLFKQEQNRAKTYVEALMGAKRSFIGDRAAATFLATDRMGQTYAGSIGFSNFKELYKLAGLTERPNPLTGSDDITCIQNKVGTLTGYPYLCIESQLPNIQGTRKYDHAFIWVKGTNELYFVEDKITKKITLNDLKKLQDILKHDRDKQQLTPEQLKNVILDNIAGGYKPSFKAIKGFEDTLIANWITGDNDSHSGNAGIADVTVIDEKGIPKVEQQIVCLDHGGAAPMGLQPEVNPHRSADNILLHMQGEAPHQVLLYREDQRINKQLADRIPALLDDSKLSEKRTQDWINKINQAAKHAIKHKEHKTFQKYALRLLHHKTFKDYINDWVGQRIFISDNPFNADHEQDLKERVNFIRKKLIQYIPVIMHAREQSMREFSLEMQTSLCFEWNKAQQKYQITDSDYKIDDLISEHPNYFLDAKKDKGLFHSRYHFRGSDGSKKKQNRRNYGNDELEKIIEDKLDLYLDNRKLTGLKKLLQIDLTKTNDQKERAACYIARLKIFQAFDKDAPAKFKELTEKIEEYKRHLYDSAASDDPLQKFERSLYLEKHLTILCDQAYSLMLKHWENMPLNEGKLKIYELFTSAANPLLENPHHEILTGYTEKLGGALPAGWNIENSAFVKEIYRNIKRLNALIDDARFKADDRIKNYQDRIRQHEAILNKLKIENPYKLDNKKPEPKTDQLYPYTNEELQGKGEIRKLEVVEVSMKKPAGEGAGTDYDNPLEAMKHANDPALQKFANEISSKTEDPEESDAPKAKPVALEAEIKKADPDSPITRGKFATKDTAIFCPNPMDSQNDGKQIKSGAIISQTETQTRIQEVKEADNMSIAGLLADELMKHKGFELLGENATLKNEKEKKAAIQQLVQQYLVDRLLSFYPPEQISVHSIKRFLEDVEDLQLVNITAGSAVKHFFKGSSLAEILYDDLQKKLRCKSNNILPNEDYLAWAHFWLSSLKENPTADLRNIVVTNSRANPALVEALLIVLAADGYNPMMANQTGYKIYINQTQIDAYKTMIGDPNSPIHQKMTEHVRILDNEERNLSLEEKAHRTMLGPEA